MALQLVDIEHRYGRRPSLRSVRMTVERGDCYGFSGHNGAGKTTTLRIALGLDRPSRGRVLVDGFAIADFPREARARLGGMIETTGFHPWASGRRNLVELARLQGIARRRARQEADRWLEVVGLGERAGSPVRSYSQGMRQRLGLAQALLGEPAYVLLDEPQNGLDPEGIVELREVLRRLTRDEGMTVLLSSHQLHELTGLCNRIGVLRQGQLLLEASTEDLVASTRSRFEIGTDDRSRTDQVLQTLGLRRSSALDEARDLVDLGSLQPAQLVRSLVQAGVGIERVVPRPTTLEEVYLRLATEPDAPPAPRGPARLDPSRNGAPSPDGVAAAGRGAGRGVADPDEPALGRPRERLAPPLPTVRMAAYDLRRSLRRGLSAMFVVAPAFLAWRSVASLAADQARHLAGVAQGDPFSTSTVTAFESLARAMIAAGPAVAVLAAAAGSQSIAGELSLGSLRNVLLRPLRRAHVVLGKALAIALVTSLSYAAALATAAVSSAAYFDFGDRFEIFHDGEPQLWIEAVDVWPLVPELLLSPMLPLLAFAGIGFAVGAMVRRGVQALGITLFVLVALEFLRVDALAAWLPSTFLPSPLHHSSYAAYFVDVSLGSAEAMFRFGRTAIITPLAWIAGTLAIAGAMLARKRVA